MPFTLIKGTFHVRNYSPDGDSIRFMPNNPMLIRELGGFKAKINAQGHVQLRIEAIDALETHYAPGSGAGILHQPLELAHAAQELLLDYVGITNVVWDKARNTVLSADDGKPGYIVARSVEKNGRPVAFVFTGEAEETDGQAIFLDEERLLKSYNYLALVKGLAYPTYYTGLFSDLRIVLSDAVREARQHQIGIYQLDVTTAGFVVDSLAVLTNDHPILPKLFRRITEYYVSTGTIVGFKEKLAEAKEPVLDLRNCNYTHFDTFVEQDGETIKLTRNPEELVFDEMPTQPTNLFARLLENDPAIPDTVRIVVN